MSLLAKYITKVLNCLYKDIHMLSCLNPYMNNTFGDLHVLTGYIQNLITLWMYVDKFVKLFKHNVIA